MYHQPFDLRVFKLPAQIKTAKADWPEFPNRAVVLSMRELADAVNGIARNYELTPFTGMAVEVGADHLLPIQGLVL